MSAQGPRADESSSALRLCIERTNGRLSGSGSALHGLSVHPVQGSSEKVAAGRIGWWFEGWFVRPMQ
jgi:hypothetical protein